MNRPRNFEEILARFPDAKPNGKGGYTASCPLPGHETPKGHIELKDAGDKALITCHGGKHTYQEFCIAWGYDSLAYSDAASGHTACGHKSEPGQRKEVAVYKYQGFEVVRYEPKDFRQRRPDGSGGYIWNLEGVTRTLYHQDELPEAIAKGATIYIVEGEKDVDRLRSLGLIATCNSGGAGKWDSQYTAALKGADIVIIPDKDKAGHEHSQKTAQSCHGTSKRIRILELPGESKDISDWLNNGGDADKLRELTESCPDWTSSQGETPSEVKITPSDIILGDELLDRISDFLLKYVVLTKTQANTVALWVAHTHAFHTADTTPYLHITSPEKRSGKTRLLEVLELVVNRPWLTGRVTPAVLARKIDQDKPTLLLDESDAAFNGEKEYAETLRGILNTGHRRGGKASVCTGQGANIGCKDLSTFCPKAIAGIGKLPDTVSDRSITIVLKRRTASEPIERFRRRKVEQPAQLLRDSLTELAAALTLTGAEPELPQELDDRAADSWEPLLAIADAVGGDWPQKARAAAIDLSCGGGKEDQSLGIRLLVDIRHIFEETAADRLPSADLVKGLNDMEDAPWVDIDHKPLTANKMARLLKLYGVTPKTMRLGAATPKGYIKAEFTEAWNRYTPALSGISTKTTDTLAMDYVQTKTATIPVNSENVAVKTHIQLRYDVADVLVAGQDTARVTVNPSTNDTDIPCDDSTEPCLVTPHQKYLTEKLFPWWIREGRQLVPVSDGHTEDLEAFLNGKDILPADIERIKKWIIEKGGPTWVS